MTIKTQKIIRFIPVVNFITLIIWLWAYLTKYIDKKGFYKTGLCMVVAVVLVNIPHIIVSGMFEEKLILDIVNWLCNYFTLFVMSFLAVRDQERIAAQLTNK